MLKLDSPALAAIFSEITTSQNNTILDLGEMRGGTFTFFSSLNCHFHSENLREFVIEHQAVAANQFNQKLDQFIRFNHQVKKFDVVLMWDLLNYLPMEQVNYLFEKLKPFCNENALIHSLTYMTKSIPEKPARVNIVDSKHITIDIQKPLTPNKHKRTSLSLVKNIADFMMETNLFTTASMTTGIKEDLLRYVPHLQNQQKNLTKKEYSYQHQSFNSSANTRIEKNILSRYQLPGLLSVLKHTQTIQTAKILDLGYDNQINGVELLNYADKVVPENLPTLIHQHGGERKLTLKSKNISFTPPVSFDTVLLWDLFHYLSQEEMNEVASRLNQCWAPGTLIHAICYSTATIPTKPQHFYLQKDQRILLKEAVETEKPIKPLNSMALLKIFKGADIKQTFLLKPGMPKGLCEFVLEIKKGD